MEAWKSYPGAPAPGTDLCADLAMGELRAVTVEGFGLVLFRNGTGLHAFVNACPHNYMPLTYMSEDILTPTGTKLVCSNHDAVFDAETGAAVSGPVQNCNLDPVPVRLDGGRVVIG